MADQVKLNNKFYNALSKGHTYKVKALLESGADPNHLSSGNLTDTPLSIALCYQDQIPENQDPDGIIKLLIEHGADVNKPSPSDGEYPIIEAMDNIDTLKLLIDNGADVNSIAYDFDGFKPTTVIKNLRNNYGHNVDKVVDYIKGTGKLNPAKCEICGHQAIAIHDSYYCYYGNHKSQETEYSGTTTTITTDYEVVTKPKEMTICENCIKNKRRSKQIIRVSLWAVAILLFVIFFLSGEWMVILGIIAFAYSFVIFSINFNNSFEHIGDKLTIKNLKDNIEGYSSYFTRSEYNLMRKNSSS